MLVASREKDIIASVKAGIVEIFRILELGYARFILGIEIDYDMGRKAYADTIKLVEDNYSHWKFNMRMKLARKGLLPQIVKPEYDQLSDRSTTEWKTNDLKHLVLLLETQLKLLWLAHIANVMKVRDALNDAYATAAMISAEINNVSCTQDFNSYAEMLYNRLNGDESELLARWQGFESLGN
ncbi:Hypothetical protein PHPALM_16972 [Phytophthora palmivora]|uniref:Uncharacterized protein n=1 Tax=Phytophthora palmivora TaxID=4796 RepID=A0A2P4XNF4_9STRA|nr:Hypothetical protein PHPALM_16972 [Phytophthora palmivora]